MKAIIWTFRIVVIAGFLAVPVSCVLDSIQRDREERGFKERYGSQVEQMNQSIQELKRIQARMAWERAQMAQIRKEMPR